MLVTCNVVVKISQPEMSLLSLYRPFSKMSTFPFSADRPEGTAVIEFASTELAVMALRKLNGLVIPGSNPPER